MWDFPRHEGSRLEFKEADENSKNSTDDSPPDGTVFAASRRASVFGVNIGGDCTPGGCKRFIPIRLCTLAYDIETRMDRNREGGFALNDSAILSIAGKSSCGDEFYVCTYDGRTSTQMVSDLLSYILDHSPLWTIGWNSYNFDNECMRYHCAPELKNLFLVVSTGAFGKPNHGSIINVVGTYDED